MKQLLLNIQPPAQPSLKNFIHGQNAEAIVALQTWMHPDNTSRFIYLWGGAGSGKSHLLKAASLATQAPLISTGADIKEALGDLPLVIVDDVHLLDADAQIGLFDLFNRLRAAGGSLLTSGNAAPQYLNLRIDLTTRLGWGLVYQLHVLSDADKAQALKHHALQRGMKLPDEVVDYCLRHLRRDLPSLMTVLDALDEWSLTEKRPITLPLLRSLLQ